MGIKDCRLGIRVPALERDNAAYWADMLRIPVSQFIREAVRDRCDQLSDKRASGDLGELFEYVKAAGDARALRDGASVRFTVGDARESSTT